MSTAWSTIKSNAPDDATQRLLQKALELRGIYERGGSRGDLDLALAAAERAVDSLTTTRTDRAMYYDNLGIMLRRRFEQIPLKRDLDNAIHYNRLATESLADAPEEISVGCWTNLANALSVRYGAMGSVADLDEALKVTRFAVTAVKVGDPNGPMVLNNLGGILLKRYYLTGSLEVLSDAVDAFESAVKSLTKHDPNGGVYHSNLGHVLRVKYQRSGSLQDLEKAIWTLDKATTLFPDRHSTKAICLDNLASAHLRLYEANGKVEALDTAINRYQKALDMTPPGHSQRPMFLSNLSLALESRAALYGSDEDLNHSVFVAAEASELTPTEHPSKEAYLGNLANALIYRFERLNALPDLNASITACESSLKLTPKPHPSRSVNLSRLGTALRKRYYRVGDIQDLDKAIEAHQEAATISETLDRAPGLNFSQLSAALVLRFLENGSRNDIDDAVVASQNALKETSEGSPSHAKSLQNYSVVLGIRGGRFGCREDLEEAVNVAKDSVRLTPETHSERALHLALFGRMLLERYRVTKSEEDLHFSVLAYEQAMQSESSPPTQRIVAAIHASQIIADTDRLRARQFLKKAVELLPFSSPRTLRRSDQQDTLALFSKLASDVAALSSDNAYEAVELLELARGIMSSVFLETRTDITKLTAVRPDLAKRFVELRNELDLVGDPNDIQYPKSETRRLAASSQFDQVLREIRGLEGMNRFLLGFSPEVFKVMASEGPIVFLNVSRYGSGCFIITTADIRFIPFPQLSYDDVESRTDAFLKALGNDIQDRRRTKGILRSILEWIWDAAVERILGELGYTGVPEDTWPRVWWIPVGRMALLPIHAAGYHDGSNRAVIDRVISSYTPTIRSLKRARVQLQETASPSETILMVAMPETPNKSSLPFVTDERNAIKALAQSQVKLESLDRPNKSDVVGVIQHCTVAHFACHGEISANPSESRLLLQDWETDPFSVADMTTLDLRQVRLGYLSACFALTNLRLSLLDESLHMTNSLQLAGIPSVIGTLWHIEDVDAVAMAKNVYSSILEEGKLNTQRAAHGLHQGARTLREMGRQRIGSKGRDDPVSWSAYCHVGA